MAAKNITPRYEFGFGLSYTTFGYSGLSISSSSTGYTISFSLTNTGSVAGTEKPQLYLGYPSAAGEPSKVLRGFEEVDLAVGQTKTVSISLITRDLRSVLMNFVPLFLLNSMSLAFGILRAKAMFVHPGSSRSSLGRRFRTYN